MIKVEKHTIMPESVSQIRLSEFAPVKPGSYVRCLPAIGASVPLKNGLMPPRPLPSPASPPPPPHWITKSDHGRKQLVELITMRV